MTPEEAGALPLGTRVIYSSPKPWHHFPQQIGTVVGVRDHMVRVAFEYIVRELSPAVLRLMDRDWWEDLTYIERVAEAERWARLPCPFDCGRIVGTDDIDKDRCTCRGPCCYAPFRRKLS